ncbi:SurA N-terminal domain-containing protein [Blastococcus sp. CCUG 61487]|uniref:SurA N-terminal domain-containing protein n=1 Tax=Blastococcus sp. CCUG 61487 TaxID=1840703 RepID=UPI001137EB3B|nr:SurA N-terminal domain-containing protein [Blastococcus sp. CCUG 61487]TKJ18790.1 hypothetical protein A6V29_10985 [Blastococcus sp. CCUG 61487]
MLLPRVPRALAAGSFLVLSLAALAGCRTSPDVAAYVGDEEVTVAELERELDERLAEDDLAEAVSGREVDYTRWVLGQLVQREVYAEVADRYDVEVSDARVRARIDELVGGTDPERVYASYVRQGVTRSDIFEDVRQQLVREEVARAAGGSALDEEALRARYAEVRDDLAQVEFGVITVPDQATADAVLAEVTADPAAYPEVAARYPGATTLPELTRGSPEEVVGVLAEQFADAPAGSGFVTELAGVDGVLVGFTTGEVVPTFQEVRPELEQQAAAEAAEAGAALVADVREDIDITVNPRYGALDDDGRLGPADGGVVEVLEREGSRAEGPGGRGD